MNARDREVLKEKAESRILNGASDERLNQSRAVERDFEIIIEFRGSA